MVVNLVLAACGGEESPPTYIPMLDYPSKLTVTEGESTTFVLSTTDFSQGDARGMFYLMNDALAVMPATFDLSPSSSSAPITISAAMDANAINERDTLTLYIYGAIGGDSPTMPVSVIDVNLPNVVVSEWNLTMPPSDTALISVRLTQPPSVSSIITLQSNNRDVVSVEPTTMMFAAANYDVPQTLTVTSNARGMASITLASEMPAAEVYVSVQ